MQKINKYWEPKKTYKRKRHNKFYAGKLTKYNQKKSDKEKSVFLLVCLLAVAINYFANTTNTIKISSDEAVHASSIATSHLAEGVDNSLSVDEIDFSRDEVEEQIRKEIKKYNWKRITPEKAIEIVRCESNFRNVKNKHSSASGNWQFTIGTWQDGCRWRGLDWTLNDRYDIARATNMAHYFIEIRGEVKRWECYRILNS